MSSMRVWNRRGVVRLEAFDSLAGLHHLEELVFGPVDILPGHCRANEKIGILKGLNEEGMDRKFK